tara:strand:- start:92 stop:436 length:345 start_codon:yes stop_codon:yes gene_type:complete
MLYQTKFLISLFITLIIELPVLFLMLRFFYKNKKISVRKIIFVGFFASALTLPYLWFVLSPYILSNYYIYFGEFLVFLVEALVYNQILELKFNKALFLSFICNLVSFIIGLMIF